MLLALDVALWIVLFTFYARTVRRYWHGTPNKED